MTPRILIATLFILSLGAWAHAEMNMGLGVMGFQAWKASRVEEAKTQLERLQAEPNSEKMPTQKPTDTKGQTARGTEERAPKLGRPDQHLSQAQLNYEIAQELSVNDYFVLYLSQFKERSALTEAARKLSVEETADLMAAYQKALLANGASETGIPSSLSSGLVSGSTSKTARP